MKNIKVAGQLYNIDILEIQYCFRIYYVHYTLLVYLHFYKKCQTDIDKISSKSYATP